MATDEQKERARVYRDAAGEHLIVAQALYRQGFLVMANYVAGLGAECILRAYRYMAEPEFDARHDLTRLYDLAKFADVVPEKRRRAINAAASTVAALWSNDHRFLTERALRKKWTRMRLYEGVKGDFLKERTRQLVSAAADLVTLGVTRWNSTFES
jgi:hypothetical protein